MPTIKSLSAAISSAISNVFRRVSRPAYAFDGIDDRGQLLFRAINPDGDIDIEFRTGPSVTYGGVDRAVVSQCLASTYTSKEFTLYFNATNGGLQGLLGGAYSNTATGATLQPNSRYRWQLVGTSLKVWFNGSLVMDVPFTRGTAREPSSLTVFGAQTHGTTSTFRAFSSGMFFDIRINGVLYPAMERSQTILLPSPSGLGSELATPEVIASPHLKGSQWTYLGDGRWRYDGDGTYNELILIHPTSQPQAGFVEFEVESISGVMRSYTATSQIGVHQSNPIFTTTGRFRHFVTSRSGVASGTYFSFVRGNAGQVASCVIKNISFKPLISAYGGELVQNGNFSSPAGWVVGAGATITNNELRINTSTVTNANQVINTVNGKVYELTFTIKSISSGTVRALLYGNDMQYVGPNRNAVGTYTELVMFNATGGSYNNTIAIQGGALSATVAVVDDVSVREVVGYCNPMSLSNTTTDRWQEIDNPSTSPIIRPVYDFDGVDDRGQLTYRAINMDGDNTFEFWSPSDFSSNVAIISQNVTTNGAGREFQFGIDAGGLMYIGFGGTYTFVFTAAQGLKPATKYGVVLAGNQFIIYEGGLNGTLIRQTSFTKGTAREPGAMTLIGCRGNGASSFAQYFNGIQHDVKINGVLYPISERDYPIQLPSPSGLGVEAITQSVLENPSSKGTQWTYLGNGRWQLNGDGTYNELIFIEVQPRAYVLDFEVESISGGSIRCFSNSTQTSAMTNHIASVPGKYRFVLSTPVSGAYQSFVRHGGSVNCVIKNISLKPLQVTSSTELLTNGSFDTNVSGWTAGGTGTTVTWSGGQAVLNCVAGQGSRMEQSLTTLQPGAWYAATAKISATSGITLARLNVIRGLAGGYAAVSNVVVGTGPSRPVNMFMAPAGDVIVQIIGDSTNAGTLTVDNISLRRIDSLCNPLVLSSITSDRWRDNHQ